MAKIAPKGKKVVGTKKKDKITWAAKSPWKKNLTVKAGAGNDVINFKKSKFKNKLYGEAGNDKIYGGKSTDKINGGVGNDKLYGNNGNDIIKAGAGNDFADGGAGNDQLYGESGANTLYGGAGNDSIWAGSGTDLIYGGAGNDVINLASGGKNTVYGDAGADKIADIKGNSIVDGGADNDTITAISGNNTLKGGAGNDSVTGGSGNDSIEGGAGNDYLAGGAGNDTIRGISGNNKIFGGAGNDVIYAGTANDTIDAGAGVNTIFFGANGTSLIENGGGRDKLVFSEVASLSDITSVYSGNDLVITAGSNTVTIKDYKNGGSSVQRIAVGDGSVSKSITRITPKNAITVDDDTLVSGTDEDDEITYNGDGALISAGDGDDIINSYGQDTIYGQKGDDFINLYENVNKEIFIAPDDGNDEIARVENTAQTNINFDSSTTYWSERDASSLVIKSIAYKDGQYVNQETTVNDYYNSDGMVNNAVADKLKINGTAVDFAALNSPVYLTENSHTSTVPEFVFGTTGNDSITGSDGNDTIYGAGGNDEINGKGGDDIIYLGSGSSTLKVDMSMFDVTVHSPGEDWEWSEYTENCAKTVYMKDDTVLTIDFDNELFNAGGLGIFCRGSGLDNDLYISVDGGLGYCLRIKDYFDENKNPKVNSVILKKGDDTYTIPEWANGNYWGRSYDIQPFSFSYNEPIYGTNMPYEEIRTAYGNHDDTVYGGSGNTEIIYPYGGHNEIHSGEGTKTINIWGAQSNNDIYLGTEATTKTTLALGGVQTNMFLVDDSGNMNITWNIQQSDIGDDFYTSTATIYNWNTRTSQVNISMTGDSRNNTLTAIDGVANKLDGDVGNDTLIGATGADTFTFDYSNGYGIDEIRNATSADSINFEFSGNYGSVAFSTFQYYKNDNGNALVINTKTPNNEDNYVIIKDYFNTTDKIDRVVASNDPYGTTSTEEMSLANIDFSNLGNFEYANGNTYTGSDNADIMLGNSGTNILEGGKGADSLYTKGGTNTFVFNAGDGSDTLYQEGGTATLWFKDTTIAALSSITGYDKQGSYDLLIHYDGENTLTVKDFYFKNNVVTQIKDSSGNTYNMADYFKNVVYVTGTNGAGTTKDDDIRVQGTSTSLIYGGKGSDRIWGGDNSETIFTHTSDWNFATFDKTDGVVDEIHAGGGNDMLVGQSSTNYLYGDAGDDTFIVFLNEGLNTYVSDSSGSGDSMNIYDGVYNNIHFVFNVDSEGNVDENGLRILNGDNFNLWKTNMTDTSIKGISVINQWDAVEKYEEAGDDYGCWHLNISAVQTVKSDIAGWLAQEGYDDVADVFKNEKTEGDITTLIGKFDITDQWQYQYYS